jgi:hypothetical protein
MARACHIIGISGDSPLAQRLQQIVGPAGSLVFSGSDGAVRRSWRRAVAGTGLQWFNQSSPFTDAGDPDITLDLFGLRKSRGRIWQITVDGSPLLSPFTGLSTCFRKPFLASLALIESNGSRGEIQLAEAHISTRLTYTALLDRLATVAGYLLRAAFLRQPAVEPTPVAVIAPSAQRHIAKERLRAAAAGAADRWRSRVTSESWAVGQIRCSPRTVLQGRLPDVTWTILPNASDNFADPFPWPGRPEAVLCERYDRSSGHGEIVTVSNNGQIVAPFDLGLSCHLSYPFTWSEPDGRHFCVPESSEARQTIIFELDASGVASRHAVIDTQRAAGDPTLFRHEGRYWLAYCDRDLGQHDTLCLMYADRLEGPWIPHRLNPVKIDVRSARPGGTPFRLDGALFRPAQDCSHTYGGAVTINRVLSCTPDSYEEISVAVLRPDPRGPYPDGLHTLSVAGDMFLVDGKRLNVGLTTLLRKAAARLRRK